MSSQEPLIKENYNPFELLEQQNQEQNEVWEKELVYRNLATYLQAKEVTDMMVRIQKKELMPNDFKLRDLIFTGLYEDEIQNKNIFYYAKQHIKEDKSINSEIKYQQIVKTCKRQKHLFWKKYGHIPPKTNELQQTRDQVSEVIRIHKMPTLAAFFGVSLAISYFMKLNLNAFSYRAAAMVTGVGLGYVYSDFKNSEKIFNSLPKLIDEDAENERQRIINYCFSVDPDLMGTTLLTEYE